VNDLNLAVTPKPRQTVAWQGQERKPRVDQAPHEMRGGGLEDLGELGSRRHDVDRLDCRQIGMNEAAVEKTDSAVPEDITQPELEELFDQVADWVIERALLTLRRPRTASG
jgi:hypothetical protein